MSNLSAETLIDPLTIATELERVTWQVDPTGGYLTTIGPHTINIYSGEAYVELRILNDRGDAVDWVNSLSEPGLVGKLDHLLSVASRKMRKVDVVITDILDRLKESANVAR